MSKREKPEKPAPRVDENGNPICGAKTKRGKGICKRPPMANGRCYHHGGASPAPGPTHPRYKNGVRSKYLPAAVAKHFDEAMADPEFLSVRENAALVFARKKQLEQRLETGESSAAWKLLKEHWGEFERGNRMQREAVTLDDAARDAMLAQSRELIGSALDNMKRIITGGASEQQQWNELLEINILEQQMKSAETARLQRAAEIMTMGEVAMLIHQIQQAIMARITDQALLRDIGTALHYIMETGSAPPPKIAGGEVIEAAVDLPNPPAPPHTSPSDSISLPESG